MDRTVTDDILKALRGSVMHYPTFFSRFQKLEEILVNCKEKGKIFDYQFPNNKGYLFSICITDNGIELNLNTPSRSYSLGRQGILRQFFTDCETFGDVLKNYKLTFAPEVDKTFYDTIINMTPGRYIVIGLNSAYSCINEDKDNLYFKKRFDGNLFDLKIEHFKNTETFIVNKHVPGPDVQYMYGRVYDSRISDMETRIVMEKDADGMFEVTDMEDMIDPGKVAEFHVGAINLRAVKDPFGKCQWYDSDGTPLDKKIIGAIYGWASKSFASTEMAYVDDRINHMCQFLSPIELNAVHDSYINQIRNCFSQGQYGEALGICKQYLATVCDISTITLTGLKKTGHDYDLVTYGFVKDPKTQDPQVVKMSYVNNRISCFPDKIEHVSEDEFLSFCKERFPKGYSLIQTNANRQLALTALDVGDMHDYIRSFVRSYGFEDRDLDNIRDFT